jgi:hypothetical protein
MAEWKSFWRKKRVNPLEIRKVLVTRTAKFPDDVTKEQAEAMAKEAAPPGGEYEFLKIEKTS